MKNRNCADCLWVSNMGCSKRLVMSRQCEWFVDWEEYTEERIKKEEDAGRTSPASGGDVRTAQPQGNYENEDED